MAEPSPLDRRRAARPRPPGVVDQNGVIITAAEVERRIMQLSDDLEGLTTEIADRAEAAAIAEAAYKTAFAQERMKARARPGHGPQGRTTADEAEDRAIAACKDQLLEHVITEAVFLSAREALRSKTTQMDALRTIAANIRAAT